MMMTTTCNPAGVLDVPLTECLLLAEGLNGRVVLRLQQMLQRLRFHVRVAGSVAAALEMARGRPPALVLAAGQAFEALAVRLSQHMPADVTERMALMAVAEQGAPEEVLRLMMAGADECLVWPFGQQVLARRLGSLPQFA